MPETADIDLEARLRKKIIKAREKHTQGMSEQRGWSDKKTSEVDELKRAARMTEAGGLELEQVRKGLN